MSTTPNPLTIAIIGTGLIGPRHAASVTLNPHTRLLALVDPSPHAQAIADSFQTAYYPSVSALLSSEYKPQAAIICTPNSTHVSIAKELANAGIHILVEKPLATDIESGRELIRFCEEKGVKLLVGHHRRFNPYVTAAKKVLDAGKLGRVLAVSGLWANCKPVSYYDSPTAWRREKSAGAVLINLVHDVDLLQYLLGPVVRVHGEKAVSTRGYDASEGGAVILRFKSSVVGTFIISDASPSPYSFEAGTGENPMIPQSGKDFYRFFGTEGTLSVGDMVRWSYDGKENKNWTGELAREEVEVGGEIPFDEQVAHLVRVVRDGEEPVCSGEEGLRALVVCDAIKRALETGEPVNIKV